MGWKGTLRTVVAASRAADRESQRRHKQHLKAQMIDAAAEAVSDWENYIKELTSIHTTIGKGVDWQSLASTPSLAMPVAQTKRQDAARRNIDRFKPSFFHLFSGGSEKLKGKLQADHLEEKKRDAQESADALRRYKVRLTEWEQDTGLAKRVLAGEVEAMREVVVEMNGLTSEGLIGSRIDFSFAPGVVHAKPEIHTDEIIPKVRRKQLASGRL